MAKSDIQIIYIYSQPYYCARPCFVASKFQIMYGCILEQKQKYKRGGKPNIAVNSQYPCIIIKISHSPGK